MDLRDSKGAIIEPKGDVDQQFGDRIYYNINIPKPEDIASLPTIPDPPPDFTGREEELQELLARIAEGSSIIGLRGIGGVGKTALAFKLAERLRESYQDGQIFVDMRGTGENPATPSEAMGSVIHAYQPEEKLPESEAEVKEMYRKVLNGKRALILLDNALDDKQTLSLIPPKSCALLVSSRKSIKLPGLFRKDLDVLKPEEAIELLRKVCCSTSGPADLPEDDPVWMEIARLCGYLPLALRAAGSYLANSEDVSPREYARELADKRTRLEVIGGEGVELGVDASLGLSFKKLQAAAQQTFMDLSAFPADFDVQAEMQICRDQGHKGLSELVRWSLVDYKPQGQDYGRYKLHDLARIFALTRQQEEQKAAISERHASYYKDLLSAADDLYLKGGDGILASLALFDLEEANILAGQAWAAKSMEKDPSAAEICMRYPDAGAYVLDLRLHPRQKIAWLENGLEAAKELKHRSIEGDHLGNLGNAYADLGETRKAIGHYEQALAIAKEIGDRRNEGAWLGNLGNAYAALGETRKAIEHYGQRLIIAREIGDRRGEANALFNSSLALFELGKNSEAIEKAESALQIFVQIESPYADRVKQQLAEWRR